METLALIALFLVLGYVLGIIGFFRAGAAHREIVELRSRLDDEIARRTAAPPPRPMAPQAAPVTPAAPPTPEAAETLETPATPDIPRIPSFGPSARLPGAPPQAPADKPEPRPQPAQPDLESVLTMRWAVGLGAVALLLAGVFLVRYAADQGLLGPATRCGAAVLLGVTLLAGAEWLRQRELPAIEGPFDIDQAPPALAAGGVAVLFGAAYGAGPFYELLPPTLAYAAMAVVSFLGLAAALWFGPLTAAVGIVGAFVSPALVATHSPSLVGLFAYLALATAAAYEVVWRTAWTWLGWAVAIAGAVWVLIATGHPDDPQIWAAGLFVPIAAFLGLLLPSAAVEDELGRVLAWGQLATIAAAGLCLEAAAPGTATRLALFAIAALGIWKGVDEPRLDRLPWLTAAVGLAALYLWNGWANAYGIAITLTPPDDAATILLAAVAFAAVHAAAGLRLESRAPGGARWSALVAAVPVLTLALCYAIVGRLEADVRWGLSGVLLALLLTLTTRRAIAQGAADRGGVHAAGVVAALALAFGMTLHDQWLTVALSLILPGLAWIEAKVALPALRTVAAVVAVTTLALLSRPLILDLTLIPPTTGDTPFVRYGLPALAFFGAANLSRRGKDDLLVAGLERGAMALAALFVTSQVEHWFGHDKVRIPIGFDEAATLMLATAAQAFAYDRVVLRTGRRTVEVARNILAILASLIAVGLLLANPMLSDARATTLSLILAYLLPAAIAGYASRAPVRPGPIGLWLAGYAVVAGFAWLTLEVRLVFHPVRMGINAARVTDAELWTWSGTWLVYGLALFILGIRLRTRLLRLAALAFVAFVCGKVFLWDMADLTGLWRVGSFLGLGLALIGLGALHRRYVLPMQEKRVAI